MLLAGDKADANGLAAENSFLRAICARGNRNMHDSGHNHILTMAVLRNCLLLPEAGIVPESIKIDGEGLWLVELTGSGLLGGATATS